MRGDIHVIKSKGEEGWARGIEVEARVLRMPSCDRFTVYSTNICVTSILFLIWWKIRHHSTILQTKQKFMPLKIRLLGA
jgi:hypothetical protein